jgi:hypothetical protein
MPGQANFFRLLYRNIKLRGTRENHKALKEREGSAAVRLAASSQVLCESFFRRIVKPEFMFIAGSRRPLIHSLSIIESVGSSPAAGQKRCSAQPSLSAACVLLAE